MPNVSFLLSLPMFKTQTEMEAVAKTAPQMRTVLNPVTLNEDVHYGYDAVLLNLPINTRETSVANLLVMLDHFAENPTEYQEFINVRNNLNP